MTIGQLVRLGIAILIVLALGATAVAGVKSLGDALNNVSVTANHGVTL